MHTLCAVHSYDTNLESPTKIPFSKPSCRTALRSSKQADTSSFPYITALTMVDNPIYLPSKSNEESQTKMPTLKSSRRINTDATSNSLSVTRASQGTGAILDFGEFNLPPRPTPDVINIPDSDDDDSHIEHTSNSDDDEEDDEDDTPAGPRLVGALPPMFYRLNPPPQDLLPTRAKSQWPKSKPKQPCTQLQRDRLFMCTSCQLSI